jgi:hypothetical protein
VRIQEQRSGQRPGDARTHPQQKQLTLKPSLYASLWIASIYIKHCGVLFAKAFFRPGSEVKDCLLPGPSNLLRQPVNMDGKKLNKIAAQGMY